MNYIYDVLLNFQKEYYDFFEWNQNDNIYHMRKIPIIKINKTQLNEIKNNIVKFENNFLNLINTKAEIFKKNNISKLKYIFIIGNNQECLAIKLNKNGIISHKSSLLPNEQDDILEIIKIQKEIKLNYTIIKNKPINNFKTRFEIENEKFIIDELNKIYKQNNYQKLNYLYLECFNHTESDINTAYLQLKQEIKKSSKNFKKLYNIFKMISQK